MADLSDRATGTARSGPREGSIRLVTRFPVLSLERLLTLHGRLTTIAAP